MKHLFLWVTILMIAYFFFVPAVESKEEERIPEEAIRLRILANSNDEADQALKLHVRDRVNFYIAEEVKVIDDKETVREMIESNITAIEKVIEDTIGSTDFLVRYDTKVPFPEKTYGQYVYPAGEYEALEITLGEGVGDNWWCVLFPPLCFVEFSSEAAVEDGDMEIKEEEQVEPDDNLRFFIWEWLVSL